MLIPTAVAAALIITSRCCPTIMFVQNGWNCAATLWMCGMILSVGLVNRLKSGINPLFLRLTTEAYVAASIDYRLDGLTSHPRQIHDCKGAIRWLRANAKQYAYDASRIGVGGGSAGLGSSVVVVSGAHVPAGGASAINRRNGYCRSWLKKV